MNTTLIFAELLVIGVEGLVWIIFLILSLFGIDPIGKILMFFDGWETGFYFIVLTMVYVFGVILDRFADSLFRVTEERIRKETVGDLSDRFVVIRYSLGKQNEYLNQQLEYTRTRMRIARASAINLPITAVFAAAFIFFRLNTISPQLQCSYILSILFAGALSYYVAIRAWKSLQKAHLNLATAMYDYETPNRTKKKSKLKKK